jgi:hypothetical protein
VKFPGKKRLAEPLRLASRIDGFNKLANEQWRKEVEARARRDQQWQSEVEAGARPDTGDASSLIRQIRLALSAIQGGRKRTLTSTVTALAWLFVLAVLAIEIHLQFESLLALGAYVLFLVAMLIIFSYARLRMLQQYSEDYRAVAEALRVQLAWWDAGLTTPKYRVDRTYLCGTSGSLALVRAAARHLIEAALLEKPAPPASADDVKRWVGGQVSFFKTRTSERRKSLSRSEGIIWFLFIGSIGIAVFLLPLTMAIYYEGNAIISWINDRIGIERPTLWSWVMPWVAAALVLGLYAMARGVSHLADTSYHGRAQRRFIGGVNSFVAFAAGLAFAVGLYGLFLPPYNFGGAVNLWRLHPVASCDLACAQLMAHKVIAGSAVVIAAIAGAFRFYDERLASEAELHSYREALASFQRAQHELNRLEDDRSEWAARRREQILRELGIIALKENEAWIRAHRVRPLEPHL